MNSVVARALFCRFTSIFTNKITYPFALLNAKPNKKPPIPFQKWNIVRGDVVKIITGKDKKKVGKVTRVWRKSNKITVRGINIKIKNISKIVFILRKSINWCCCR